MQIRVSYNIMYLQCIRTIDWIRSEGHTGVIRYDLCTTKHYFIIILYCGRHLQADSWKIISAADDKTLKVSI